MFRTVKSATSIKYLNMRLLRPLVTIITLALFSVNALGQDVPVTDGLKEKHSYQSDVSRLRNIVINRCVQMILTGAARTDSMPI